MSEDEKLVLGLFRKLLDESYVDTEFHGEHRLCVDGTLHEVSTEELDAMERWYATA